MVPFHGQVPCILFVLIDVAIESTWNESRNKNIIAVRVDEQKDRGWEVRRRHFSSDSYLMDRNRPMEENDDDRLSCDLMLVRGHSRSPSRR